jgi:hypothetical protein
MDDHQPHEAGGAVDDLPFADQEGPRGRLESGGLQQGACGQGEQPLLVVQVEGGSGERHIAAGDAARRQPAPKLGERLPGEYLSPQRGGRQERSHHPGDVGPGDVVVVALDAANAALPVELRVLLRVPPALRECHEVAHPPRVGVAAGDESLRVEAVGREAAGIDDEQAVRGVEVGKRVLQLRRVGDDTCAGRDLVDLVSVSVPGAGGGDHDGPVIRDRLQPRTEVTHERAWPNGDLQESVAVPAQVAGA